MHPPLYPFNTKGNWLKFAKLFLGLNETQVEYATALLNSKRIPLITGRELSIYLGISARHLTRATAVPDRYYRTFEVRKKRGGVRVISAPRVYLKVIQHYILDCILSQAELPPYITGFVRGKSTRDNASPHIGAAYLWNIDLKNFFPSITQSMACSVFLDLGYNNESATLLSKLCCLRGVLPQGAPTSPMVANLAFIKYDHEIQSMCAANQITYTRYADDLTFSSSTPIAEAFRMQIEAIITSSPFSINTSKTRLVGPRCRREVTGYVVNKKLSVPRAKRRLIRAMAHAFVNKKDQSTKFKQKLIGHITQLRPTHPEEADRHFNAIMRSD